MVVFEAMAATAFCSCATVATRTTVPAGGGTARAARLTGCRSTAGHHQRDQQQRRAKR
jgi:hypothetical protein